MNINIGDILTLDNNIEYVVVSKANFNNKEYYYLVNKTLNDVKFCYQDGEELVELNDKELITKLLPLFTVEAKKVIENTNM